MINFTRKPRYGYEDLLEIIRLLRSPEGCPWDRVQTHQSIRRGVLEEAYEAAEAIDTDNAALLKEELGDVLMQVVFHAGIEADAGRFDMDDVCDGVVKKLLYRHPHVFGNGQTETADTVPASWEQLKRQEKGQKCTADALDAVARSLPGLWRAEKIQKKAAEAGFRLARRLRRAGQAGRGDCRAAAGGTQRHQCRGGAGRRTVRRRKGGSLLWRGPGNSCQRYL